MTYAQPMAGDPTSVVGRRIGAWFIDLVVYLILAVAITAAFGGGGANTVRGFPSDSSASTYCDQWRAEHNGFCFSSADGDTFTATTLEPTGASFWLPVHFVLYSVLQGITGASLGKMAVGLRVVTADGQRCGLGRSFLRTLLWIVDAITCALPILGGILILSTKGHRRVGDMAAKTFVVPKEAEGSPIAVPGVTAPAAGPGFGAAPYGAGHLGGGWPSDPAAPTGWSGAPSSAPQGTWAPTGSTDVASATGDTTGDGPTWDAARNAYIQYDREQSAWVQWNDDAKSWRPIDQ